jgi:shikimate dehydrogenase
VTTAKTRLLALLGHPVAHSRSPAMMTAALAALGRSEEFSYLAFDVDPADLEAALRGLAALGCRGINVTAPHKQAVLSHCVTVDDDVERIGAANVLAPVARGFSAHNTDAPGAARALADAGARIAGAKVVVLGAGGAARAVCVGLAREGAQSITVIGRSLERALRCAQRCEGLGLSTAQAMALDEPRGPPVVHASADIIVQCTPLGMTYRSVSDPAARSRHAAPSSEDPSYRKMLEWLDHVRPGCVAMDLVYEPVRTAWLERARSRGAITVDGLGMLAHQGALALARFCGGAPPPIVFRRFLDESSLAG